MFRLNTKFINVYSDENKIYRAIRLVLLTGYFFLSIRYVLWRGTVLNPLEPIASMMIYSAEVYIFLVSFLFVLSSWRVKDIAIPPVSEGLNVDVFVTTYNEPMSIVRRTVLGAVNIEYPHKTWLLDDGNRPEMKALAEELGCRYIAREKNSDAKAGNLNNALQYSDADFIAFFDADHIPEKTFLHRTLGYFSNEKLGFLQSPQGFYNIDSFEHTGVNRKPRVDLWEEQSLFYRLIHPGKDTWNGMFFCGCSGVIRRSSLDKVGGFVTESPTEDFQTSLRIQKNGEESFMVRDTLAYGIGATRFDVFLKQRFRWMQGNLLSCSLEKVPFTKGLSFMQRVCYANVLLGSLEGWSRLVFYLTPVLVLIFDAKPIISTLDEHLSHLLPFVLIVIIYYLEFGRGYAKIIAAEHFSMAKFYIYCIAFFGLFRVNGGFNVTPKTGRGKFPLLAVLPQIIVFVASLVGVFIAVFGDYIGVIRSGWLIPIVGFWACVNALLSWSVISRALQSYNNETEFFDFEVPLPLEIDGKETFVTTRISSKKIIANASEDYKVGESCPATLFLPSGHVRIGLTITSYHNGLLQAEPNWKSQTDIDALDLALHHCTWHRILLEQREYVKTPLFWIDRFIRRLLGKQEQEIAWKLFPYKTEEKGPLYIGLTSYDKKSGTALNYQLLFSFDQRIMVYDDFSLSAANVETVNLKNSNHEAPSGLYLMEKTS